MPASSRVVDTRLRRQLLEFVQRELPFRDGVKLCGLAPIPHTPGPQVRRVDGRHHVRGVIRCGRNVCPVCAPRVRHHHADEIDRALAASRAAGGVGMLVTLTVPAHGVPLKAIWADVSAAWSALMVGSFRARWRAMGVQHTVRSIEATYSTEHGWHAHVHAVLVFDHDPGVDLAPLYVWLRAAWSGQVTRRGYRAPDPIHGVDLRTVHDGDGLGAYLVKEGGSWSAGLEVAGAGKGGRGGSRSPIELLADAAEGDDDAWRHWLEYLTVTKGRRTVSWSRGARDDLIPGYRELSDEEIVEASERAGEVVAEITRDAWREIVAAQGVARMLEGFDHRGILGAVAALRAGGVLVWPDRRAGPVPVLRLGRTPGRASPG